MGLPVPTLGYPSKGAAIIGLWEAGSHTEAEIAALVGQTEASVKGTISGHRAMLRRTAGGLTIDKREKAIRIYKRTLALIAEALGGEPHYLHSMFKELSIAKTSAPPAQEAAPPSPLAAAPRSAGGEHPASPADTHEPVQEMHQLPEPEPASMMMLKAKSSASHDEHISAGLVTLKSSDGRYLHLSGQMMTRERYLRYSGTVAQAKRMRETNPVAKGLSISHFTTPKV